MAKPRRTESLGRLTRSALLPTAWTGPSTNRELAKALKQPYFRIARMTYCLSRMDLLKLAGKQGRSLLYALA